MCSTVATAFIAFVGVYSLTLVTISSILHVQSLCPALSLIVALTGLVYSLQMVPYASHFTLSWVVGQDSGYPLTWYVIFFRPVIVGVYQRASQVLISHVVTLRSDGRVVDDLMCLSRR